jgi:hypothetical protein
MNNNSYKKTQDKTNKSKDNIIRVIIERGRKRRRRKMRRRRRRRQSKNAELQKSADRNTVHIDCEYECDTTHHR